jgi:hypothetical protein
VANVAVFLDGGCTSSFLFSMPPVQHGAATGKWSARLGSDPPLT